MSRYQEIQFELLRMGSFNGLNGDMVADKLAQNEHLWEGFLFDRECWHKDDHIDFIRLRDIKQGINADTLYIKPVTGKEEELYQLAKSFNADGIHWHNGWQIGKVLRVWWD